MHNESVVLAAAMLALLEVSERSVARHCPSCVIVGVGGLVTPGVVVAHAWLERSLQAVEYVCLVERAGEAALAAGTVVRRDEDQCVVEAANTSTGGFFHAWSAGHNDLTRG